VFIFAGAKFGENVLKWDAFNYATKFRAMAIYMILFECEIIILFFTPVRQIIDL
jgi:hypothetical protein